MDTRDPPDPLAMARDLGAAIATAADAVESTRRIPEPLLARLHEFAAVPDAVAALRGRRPDGAGTLSVGDRRDRPPRCLRCLECVRRQQLLSDCAVSRSRRRPNDLRRSNDHVAWGPPNATRASAVAGGYRVSGTWDFASGCRNANWMGAHCHVVEVDGSLRINGRGRPVIRSLLFPAEQATLIDTWNTIGLRGTASDSYSVADLFVPESFQHDSRGARAASRTGTALRLHDAGPLCRRRGERRSRDRAGDARCVHRPCRQEGAARPGASRRQRSCAGGRGAGGSQARRGPGLSAGDAGDDLRARGRRRSDRHRRSRAGAPRLHQCHPPRHRGGRLQLQGCGCRWIFPGSPFERRFRDIHTLSQQIQARGAHFETVGQILLGMLPEVFL